MRGCHGDWAMWRRWMWAAWLSQLRLTPVEPGPLCNLDDSTRPTATRTAAAATTTVTTCLPTLPIDASLVNGARGRLRGPTQIRWHVWRGRGAVRGAKCECDRRVQSALVAQNGTCMVASLVRAVGVTSLLAQRADLERLGTSGSPENHTTPQTHTTPYCTWPLSAVPIHRTEFTVGASCSMAMCALKTLHALSPPHSDSVSLQTQPTSTERDAHFPPCSA